MTTSPQLRFLSLFVPDLDDAARRYEAILGVPPKAPASAPARHPFSPRAPVVFDLGGVEIALYQADGTTTHAGDVGIGLVAGEPAAVAQRASQAGARAFPGLRALADGRQIGVFVTPDRHFFEVVSR